MQSNAANILVAVGANAATNANSNAANTATGEDLPSGKEFSQLLSDSGAQTQGDGAQKFPSGSLPVAAAAGVIAVQEIDALPVDGLIGDATGLQDRLITVEEATKLIARIDQFLGRGKEGGQVAALNQLKEQLQRIVRAEEPKSVSVLLQNVPTAKEGKIGLQAIIAILAQRKHVINATKKEEASNQATAALQHVSAAVFRSSAGEIAPAAALTGEEEKTLNSDVANIVVPLGATFATTATATTNLSPQVQIQEVSASALSNQQTLDQRIAALNAAIAPISSGKEEMLPQVDLPSLTEDSATPSLTSNADVGVNAKPAIIIGDKNMASFASLLNPTVSAATAPAQPPQAAPVVQLVPTQGYLNQAPVTDQVKVAVHQAATNGANRITIQLDPIELGRIEVNMQTNREGVTSISFMVDKPETFDSLARDARFLERALMEVGIKSDTGNMQFNLRQPPQPQLHSNLGGQGQQQSSQSEQADSDDNTATLEPVAALSATTQHYTLGVREGVDISA